MSYTPPTHEEHVREYMERMMFALERIADALERQSTEKRVQDSDLGDRLAQELELDVHGREEDSPSRRKRKT